jgi:predicted transcriptional regulator
MGIAASQKEGRDALTQGDHDSMALIEDCRTLVLSVKPVYVQRILSGEKTVELRRRFPSLSGKCRVLLYSTSPVQAIVCSAELKEVSHHSLQSLWKHFSVAIGVTRQEFNAYFAGVDNGYALRRSKVRALVQPLHLSDLSRDYAFHPPQSYCYWKTASALPFYNVRVKATT